MSMNFPKLCSKIIGSERAQSADKRVSGGVCLIHEGSMQRCLRWMQSLLLWGEDSHHRKEPSTTQHDVGFFVPSPPIPLDPHPLSRNLLFQPNGIEIPGVPAAAEPEMKTLRVSASLNADPRQNVFDFRDLLSKNVRLLDTETPGHEFKKSSQLSVT